MESPTSSPSRAEPAPGSTRSAIKLGFWVGIGVVAGLVSLGAGEEYAIQIPVTLAFGWAPFAWNNVITAQLNWLLIAEAVLCTIALGIGGHYFMRWLWAQMAPEGAKVWRAQWTVAGLGGLLLLFVAGIATIGITHQTAWIFTDKGPFIETRSYVDRVKVGEAIRAGGPARLAVQEHFAKTGRLPETAAAAGFDRASAASQYVKTIDISKGVINIEVVESLGGGMIVLMPVINGSELSFTCGGTMSAWRLPGSCRGPR